MKKLFKFAVIDDSPGILMPEKSVIVDFQIEGDSFYLWAMIDKGIFSEEARVFKVIATGQEFEDSWAYWRTCHHRGFVWHLIEDMGEYNHK